MTNSTTVNATFPVGDRWMADVTVNITSLGANGTEAWVPATEIDTLDAVDVVIVGSQETEGNLVTYDHVNEQFDVVQVSDGSDTGSGTDVGEVELLALGVR